jgi:glucan phosphorylase
LVGSFAFVSASTRSASVPGYWAARMIIKLLNALADTINRDPRTRDLLKVVFVPDYKVSVVQKLVAAAVSANRSPLPALKPREPAT